MIPQKTSFAQSFEVAYSMFFGQYALGQSAMLNLTVQQGSCTAHGMDIHKTTFLSLATELD